MAAILERLGVQAPIVQAGMGGGLSRHELAAAVSEAGGLGTIAVNGAAAIERQLAAARELTAAPIAVNLLLPFARRSWFEAAAGADAVVTFWGTPRRRTPGVWMHQCGSVAEARSAHAAGADAIVVQGVEAGGHVRGTAPALELHEKVRTVLPAGYPTLIAGGIAERGDVERALEAGACGAVAGTRFLLSDESRAHPLYKQRALEAADTVLTELFGFGWPAPHRVVRNAATERRLAGDARGPRLNRALNRLAAPGARFMPGGAQLRLARAQRPGSRLLTPIGATEDGPANLVEAGPLYAGETVARIGEVWPAAKIVRALMP
ncbi:MAG TPA: nitronate monooxygenase [Solirubrobacterales bacterium]|jgi:NAD(P)H-dependent flavin oxidoreductase YrpB (nitropropane dioxygenase family)|nr:nitronate monooxygenase [Solirubrobacterales bacterium]